jgi:hypothetical protein
MLSLTSPIGYRGLLGLKSRAEFLGEENIASCRFMARTEVSSP